MPTIACCRCGGNAAARIVRLSGRTTAAPSPSPQDVPGSPGTEPALNVRQWPDLHGSTSPCSSVLEGDGEHHRSSASSPPVGSLAAGQGLTWLRLVRTGLAVDAVDGVVEVTPRGVRPADLLMAANSRSNIEATVDKAFVASCKAHAANSPQGCDNSVPITTVRRPDGQLRVRTGHRPSAACALVSPYLRPGRTRCHRHVARPDHPSHHAAANPRRPAGPAQLSPAARWNVWAMIS